MILGIGVDIVEIARIAVTYERHQARFLERLLTASELDYWQQSGARTESLAGVWAAKEAVSKALGTGFSGFGLRDIVIEHDGQGKPEVRLSAGALRLAEARGIKQLLVTISHSSEQAIAFALAQ